VTRVRPRLLGVLALTFLVVASATGVWAGEPTDTMRDFFSAVNLVLTDSRTDDQPAEKLRAIRRHVDEVLDVREAAMLALGREWAPRTAAEQNEFVALFADLLERSFVWRIAGKASLAGGVKVQYLGETVAGDTATVDTAVSARDGNDLRLEYRMVRRAGRWVVRDVVMDGVSTMENYHAQFQRIARDGSWPELMGQLRAKVGAPSAVQVAAPAPVPALATLTPSATPLAAPLDLDRPAPDERHLAARDLAAVVTPGLAIRDVSPLPGPSRTAAHALEPASAAGARVPRRPEASRRRRRGRSRRSASGRARDRSSPGDRIGGSPKAAGRRVVDGAGLASLHLLDPGRRVPQRHARRADRRTGPGTGLRPDRAGAGGRRR
jgi:phospholipid transport system substrate-binding protein